MHSTCENSTESDPEEYDRSPQSTLQSTKDRAKARDVEELYQEQLPCRKYNIVNTIVNRDRRGLPVIRCEDTVNYLTVGEVAGN